MDLGGTNYAVTHQFVDGFNDGRNPHGDLVQSGSALWGMSEFGGVGGNGVTFSTALDASSFTIQKRFAGAPSDASQPSDSLVAAGNVLYGMTPYGGPNNVGVLFKVNSDNTGYTVLHYFTGGASDGAHPVGSVVVSGNTIYGATRTGGASDQGTVFKMNIDGTGFSLLHTFDAATGDAAAIPAGTPVLAGANLYLMTSFGGFGNGTIYRVGIDGSNPQVLHYFMGSPSGGSFDGYGPSAEMTLVGNVLYAMTPYGGRNALGTILDIDTDGSNYQILYDFTGGVNDGSFPNGALLYSDGVFYGTTNGGGAYGLGTVFEFTPIPEPSTLVLTATAAGGLLAYLRRRKRVV
jgi:uncharacterized repeat protein (TIGR03803 family)